jgi:general L-amino acid transport system permease protein
VAGWLKKNLFANWWSALLTLAALWFIYKVGGGLLVWVVRDAEWSVIGENLRILMVGAYPPEHLWRIWTALALVTFWSGVSWGAYGAFNRRAAVGLGAALLLLQVVFPLALASRIWVAVAILLIPAGFFLGARVPRAKRGWLLAAWVPCFLLGLLLLGGARWAGLAPVESSVWNGLLLTVLLSVTGMVACFPLGVLLALGRQSSLPAVRWVSVAYIETVRGVPLISILFMASLVIPLFLPASLRFPDLMRAFIGLTLFEAAYMAENIRGGLQAIPKGQIEAAQALGLKAWQRVGLIQLPQALRAVIPAMVGQVIALLKDTSLISIINLAEFTFVAKGVLRRPENLQYHYEVYVFVAAVYWLLCYSLSIASRRLEKRLGVGER